MDISSDSEYGQLPNTLCDWSLQPYYCSLRSLVKLSPVINPRMSILIYTAINRTEQTTIAEAFRARAVQPLVGSLLRNSRQIFDPDRPCSWPLNTSQHWYSRPISGWSRSHKVPALEVFFNLLQGLDNCPLVVVALIFSTRIRVWFVQHRVVHRCHAVVVFWSCLRIATISRRLK